MKTISDSIVLDWRELQLKWAVDDLANEIGELMDFLEKNKDPEAFERFCAVIKAINNYNRLLK